MFTGPEWVSHNDFELATRACKEMEYLLETGFQATGNGLGEKMRNCEDRRSFKTPRAKELTINTKYITRIRNNLIHDRDCNKIDNRAEFIKRCTSAIEILQAELQLKTQGEQGIASQTAQYLYNSLSRSLKRR